MDGTSFSMLELVDGIALAGIAIWAFMAGPPKEWGGRHPTLAQPIVFLGIPFVAASMVRVRKHSRLPSKTDRPPGMSGPFGGHLLVRSDLLNRTKRGWGRILAELFLPKDPASNAQNSLAYGQVKREHCGVTVTTTPPDGDSSATSTLQIDEAQPTDVKSPRQYAPVRLTGFSRSPILRSLLVGAALFCSLLAPVHAAGPHDGIYAFPDGSHISVHQKGNLIIAAAFWTIPATGVNFSLGDGQSFPPPRVDVWELYTGTVSNNTVTLNGESQYGACMKTYALVFDAAGVSVRWNSIAQTAYGTSQRINCQAYMDSTLTRSARDFYAVKVY